MGDRKPDNLLEWPGAEERYPEMRKLRSTPQILQIRMKR